MLSAVLGGALDAALRPRAEDDRKLDWLARELSLTATQRAKVAELHLDQCPEIGRLAACPVEPANLRQECRRATAQLVAAVSAELTPSQRERYLELVASCVDPADLPRHP